MMKKATAASFVYAILFFVLYRDVWSQTDTIASPMMTAEQETLYLVIQDFVGSQWNGSDLYPDPCGWTPIQGVSCDIFEGLWYVTVINIGPIFDNSLECSPNAKFSPYIFSLKHLSTLSIFNCFTATNQHASIPFEGWEMLSESLETLELRMNDGLNGVIPSSIGLLTNLQSLVLIENSLTGELPQEIGNLANLKRLSLAKNKFTGEIPNSIGQNLAQLLIFDCSENYMTGPIPSSLGSMSSLLKLDLNSNNLDGYLPRELSNLSKLTLLDLRNNNISGLCKCIESLASLEHLLLSNNPLGGNFMDIEWQNMKNLATLDLVNTKLSGSITENIELRKLRYLALNNNNLSGNVPAKLSDLPSLSALYLHGNNFTGKLQFSDEFYGRLGRRFSCWDNPNLCYIVGNENTGNAPLGVQPCKH